jgi:hypothetical protein
MSDSPFQKAIEEMRVRRQKAIEEACLLIEADAKMMCPVRTGTLKRSITHEVRTDDDKTEGAVGSNVEYAYWAERKRPYLEPAVDKNLEQIRRRIAEVLNNGSD